MVEKWYRGHEGSRKATDNRGIIWLTSDYEYAQEYANEYPDGVVSTIFVDEDKIEATSGFDYDLDWYFPDDEDIEAIKNDGYNAYYFEAGDGIECLALLSAEPIVKVENSIIESIDINEIKYMVKEAIQRLLKK